MDTEGRLYRRCECGTDVYSEPCHECGKDGGSALSDLFDAVELPDLEGELRRNHAKLQRQRGDVRTDEVRRLEALSRRKHNARGRARRRRS